MKKLWILNLMLCCSLLGNAQGIQFETGTWDEVVKKAQKENKMIYLDVYASWCGPCKMMAAKIFPLKEAGDKYNALFVNYKIDAEVGEGIDIAKKYGVNAYPTNLYIHPHTQEVIYLALGATLDVADFNKRADIAMAEFSDPLNWEGYEAKFKSGERNQEFLRKFLEKSIRLEKNNDEVLSEYISQYLPKGNLGDRELRFLLEYTKTIDNKAFPILTAQKDKLNSALAGNMTIANWYIGLSEGTVKKAIETKNEKLLEQYAQLLKVYNPRASEAGLMYALRKQYYLGLRDKEKFQQARFDEANYLATRPSKFYEEQDQLQFEEIKADLKKRLLAHGMSEDLIELSLVESVKANPAYRKNYSATVANALNEISWMIYQNKDKYASTMEKALQWSEKSVQLTEELPDLWPMCADTYAHLLYVNGKKDEAIAIQEKAVRMVQQTDEDMYNELNEELEKMKTGSLEK